MGNGKARLRKTIMNKAAYTTTASRTIPDLCLSSDLARATMALLADEGPVAKAMISCGRQWSRPTKEQLRSEEHTSELQSLMRISYAVFFLTKIYCLTTISTSS